MDLFPTALDLAGVPLPTDREFDGKSMLPILLHDQPSAHEMYVESVRIHPNPLPSLSTAYLHPGSTSATPSHFSRTRPITYPILKESLLSTGSGSMGVQQVFPSPLLCDTAPSKLTGPPDRGFLAVNRLQAHRLGAQRKSILMYRCSSMWR